MQAPGAQPDVAPPRRQARYRHLSATRLPRKAIEGLWQIASLSRRGDLAVAVGASTERVAIRAQQQGVRHAGSHCSPPAPKQARPCRRVTRKPTEQVLLHFCMPRFKNR